MDIKKRKLKIEYNINVIAADEDCGDFATAFKISSDKRAFVLSDGMGKGIEASCKSKNVVNSLRKLLKQGLSPAKSIRIVNKRLIEKREIFATIDLLIVNDNTGRANFYKMGSAKSYLVRGNKVRVIESEALPVGIVSKLVFRRTTLMLKPGDLVVMVSDGITEADRNDLECLWIEDFLDCFDKASEELSRSLLEKAEEKRKQGEKDDMSIIEVKVI